MHYCSQDRIYLIKNDRMGLKSEPEVPTLKIELPKKKEIISKKPKLIGDPVISCNYAYSFDQIISSSPNTTFFINSLKTRLNKY